MTEAGRQYLIVGPSWVGDMVMAQSLFMVLKQRYPDCEIDVVAPEWSLPILKRMPEVREGFALPVMHGKFSVGIRYRLGRSLKGRGYSHAIVLPRSWKSALVPFFAAVPVRTGYRGEMRFGLLNDIRRLDATVLTQTVQRYVAHAYEAYDHMLQPPVTPYPELRPDFENASAIMRQYGLHLEGPVVGFMPGAEYGPSKQWRSDYFARLGKLLVADGYQVWIFGSKKEKDLGDVISKGVGKNAYNLCGKTGLVDAADLIACCEQVVSNDSGLMHLAAAMGVRVNAIYGSSTPDYTPPLTDSAEIFYRREHCSPCFQRVCPLGHTNCMVRIRPEDVYSRITH